MRIHALLIAFGIGILQGRIVVGDPEKPDAQVYPDDHERNEVTCKDLPQNAPPSVRLAVCGNGRRQLTEAELQAKQHASQLTQLSRQLAEHIEGAAWCGHVARPPAPAKACFSAKPTLAPLCARSDEVLAAATSALKAKVSAEVAALLAPQLAAQVGSMLGVQNNPPKKDVVDTAGKMAQVTIQQLAELKAAKLVRAENPKMEAWKIDVKTQELVKAKTKQLAEDEARALYSGKMVSTNAHQERAQKECDGVVAWFSKLDRMDSEGKRLLTGARASHWRDLATRVSAASTDRARDYHDRYALAEALTSEDAAWLEAEMKREVEPSAATMPAPPDVNRAPDADRGIGSGAGSAQPQKSEHGDAPNSGIADPFASEP